MSGIIVIGAGSIHGDSQLVQYQNYVAVVCSLDACSGKAVQIELTFKQ